jgi:hypothetical protein
MTLVNERSTVPTSPCAYDMAGPTKLEQLRLAMAGGAFDDRADPAEGISMLGDGKPVVAER